MEPDLDPDSVEELMALNNDLINVEEHLLKAHRVKHIFKSQDS